MRDWSSLAEVPRTPGVYCLMSDGARRYPVYVGTAKNLRTRLEQHLAYRNSSVATGVSPASINPDLIGGALWWTNDRCEDRDFREAFELVAFDVLNPVLRSRGNPVAQALVLAADTLFQQEVRTMLNDQSNSIRFPSVADLARRVRELEDRLAALESKE